MIYKTPSVTKQIRIPQVQALFGDILRKRSRTFDRLFLECGSHSGQALEKRVLGDSLSFVFPRRTIWFSEQLDRNIRLSFLILMLEAKLKSTSLTDSLQIFAQIDLL